MTLVSRAARKGQHHALHVVRHHRLPGKARALCHRAMRSFKRFPRLKHRFNRELRRQDWGANRARCRVGTDSLAGEDG